MKKKMKNNSNKTKNKKKIKKWIEKNYDHISNIISAIVSVLLSLLASYIYSLISNEDTSGSNTYILLTLIGIVFLIIIMVSKLSKRIKEYVFADSKHNIYIRKAYFAIQSLTLESQCYLSENEAVDFSAWYLNNIQLTVNKCYDFMCSSFGESETLIEEIKFEVTYMTESYKDSEITIPCSCNKERREPTSMLIRDKNKKIYGDTVTAEIYKEYDTHCKPAMKIIENTSSPINGEKPYHFLYENQSQRIKSSIVLPVLSHKSKLLGTLVVHCNTPDFFKKEDENFWYEILQIFACEIGKNKLLLDNTIDIANPPF
ncbi:MAG: GAF domain-containing protein [Lachnospiraceae bacterium]|nr:GAF domain-containing protein [Lachnospiraceae bacterium]